MGYESSFISLAKDFDSGSISGDLFEDQVSGTVNLVPLRQPDNY
jgi:hypothetical protein